MNNSWGYKKSDNDWKTSKEIVDKLQEINKKGGNLLLNIGPDGNGVVPAQSVIILKEAGKLLKLKR